MKKIKWIFFDVGSTLVDETKAYDHRAFDMIEGTDITFEEFDKKRKELAIQGYDGNSAAINFFGLKKTPWHTEDEVLYSDAESVLKQLKASGYYLGIIANQEAGLSARLEKWGILECFDIIVSSSDVGISKPNVRIFEEAARRAKCRPEECMMVGDRLDNDIIPASSIGMKTIWIKNGLSKLQNDSYGRKNANYTIYNLAEICDIFE